MAERETSRSIDAAAAAWVAREDRAPLSPGEQKALKAWLEGDSRRAGAYLRARAVSMRSESARALGPRYDPADFGGRRSFSPSRRDMLAWGGSAAASAAVGAVAVVSLQAPRAHATERGEIRLLPMEDGSTVMLNTETLVKVKYDDRRRYVRLVEGEADFTVLADRDRPFIVEAGERRLSAVAGAFRVRKLKNGPVDILVHRGRVEVTAARGRRSSPVVLDTNTRLTVADSAAAIEISPAPWILTPDAVTRELAWREGKIAFQGESLAEAAAAFARYSDTRIVIEDPDLAREPITGLFAANDPVGFGRAAASVFAAPASVREGAVVIGRSPIKQ